MTSMARNTYLQVVDALCAHRFLVVYHVFVQHGNELAKFVDGEGCHGDDGLGSRRGI